MDEAGLLGGGFVGSGGCRLTSFVRASSESRA